MEDTRPFIRVARHLRALGLSAPALLAVDESRGFLLLEDLGDRTFTSELNAGADEKALYDLALEALIALHRHPAATALDAPPYDDDRLIEEASLLTDWFIPAMTGRPCAEPARAAYVARWRQVLPAARAVPDTLVLRDYHVDNLMVLSGREAAARCGLLDFQDAVIGPVSYDLISLIEDARRDVPGALAARLVERYLASFPTIDRARFAASLAVLGAQRNAKIIGIFTRLHRRDGKARYLEFIPRVWRLLEGDLAHPALAPVAEWFARHVPAALRVRPRAA
jgi:aminoglycoside/choline kinase family phosphotransferase